jgi:hypothetical protein
MLVLARVVNNNHKVCCKLKQIAIVNYDRKTFIVQAAGD